MQNLIAILVMSLLPILSWSQISFFRQFSSSGHDFAEGIVQLEDSSYVICGSSSSFANGPSDAFLLKIDSLGTFQWSNHYGGSESESAKRVMYQQGFGFFIAGYTNSFGNGAYDFYLAKIDENAQLEWERSYGSAAWERVHDAALTRDTGVIMLGETNNASTGKDIYIVRTNSVGDTLWTKTIGGPGDDVGKSLATYQDSMFVIAADYYNTDSLKTKVYLAMIHEDGTIMFDRHVPNQNGHIRINDIIAHKDTVAGVGNNQLSDTSSLRVEFYRFLITPTSFDYISIFAAPGNGEWNGKLITNYRDEYRRYVVFENENNPTAYEGGTDVTINTYRWNLSFLGQIGTVATYEPDVANHMVPTSDGGAIMVGYRVGVGEGGGTVFAYKIGPGEVFPFTWEVTLYSSLVDVDEIAELEGAKVYPNPTNSLLTVELEDYDAFEMKLVNLMGQVIVEDASWGEMTLDVSSLAPGIYMLELLTDDGRRGSYRVAVE